MVSHLNEWPELGTNRGALNVRKWVMCYPTRREHIPQPPAEQEAEYYAGSW